MERRYKDKHGPGLKMELGKEKIPQKTRMIVFKQKATRKGDSGESFKKKLEDTCNKKR